MSLGIESLIKLLAHSPVWLIIDALRSLVLNRLALHFELLFRQSWQEESHTIRLEPKHLL